jgi:hypothetical protein
MTRVHLTLADDPPLPLDLDEFILANDLDADEETAIRQLVGAGRPYRGGGGAAPEWTIERAHG